ncbi:MAG: TIGR04282 family arsenosugar biosynthesis glycosyltransferase [Candidatus Gracilibacteria bacterium]|nr:TIGR04282 family arsenosugar biosynthesis glycosyltransferase [Candidatus Gracilibacteria bacterium]
MKKIVVMLTKFPEAGNVKTRLAKDIGFDKSAQVQEIFIKNLLNNNYFNLDKKYDFKVCLKERYKINDFVNKFGVKNEDIFFPIGDDLGSVMSSIFKKTIGNYEEVLLIGSDIPLLQDIDFKKAFTILENKDFVLGKAIDGGYYLVGMKDLNTYIFDDIIYSTPGVLDETVFKIVNNSNSYGLLIEKRDIDELSDIIEEAKIDKSGFFKTVISKINEK